MQADNSIACLVEAGVDWITARATPEADPDSMKQLGYSLTYDEIHRGHKPSAWTFFGYSGVTAGDVSWGVCERGCIVQLRGPMAALHWPTAARLADRINRLDIMATVRTTVPDLPIAQKLWEAYQVAPNGNHRKAHAALVTNDVGGGTFYYGRRGSEWFTRVYDKAAESPRIHAYANCWRYEAELTGKTALTVVGRLLTAPDSRRECVGLLYAYLTDRGLPCLLPSDNAVRVPVSHVSASSDSAALDWLAHSVQPTVRRLLRNGRAEAVLDALGLGDWPGLKSDGANQA